MRDPTRTEAVGRLKRRADFARVAKGRRVHGKAFSLQVSNPDAPSSDAPRENPRVGFTLTRKLGGAVVRNRARRRLKEAIRLSADLPMEAGRDYVLVGRIDAIRIPFDTLKQDLLRAFSEIRRGGGSRSGRPRPQRTRPTA